MKYFTLVLVLFLSLHSYSQIRRNRDPFPVAQSEPSEADIERQKRKIEERKEEYIANFITTLEADDFQKEIIKQTITDFYEKRTAVLKAPYENNFKRVDAYKKFKENHFKDLKELISESDMAKIETLISGKFDEKEALKKEKKKRKKKRNKD